MSRPLLIAAAVSLLLHAGLALSSYLVPEPAPAPAAEEEIPVIALDLPPPPEPEEPEIFDNLLAGDPAEEPAPASLAPPMLNDAPSAVIDSPFVQQIQPPPPPGLDRTAGDNIVIPVTTRPSVGSGQGLGNIFDLAALDQRPEVRVRTNPVYPFEMRRSGLRGEVVVGFVIDARGDVRDPYIVNSTNPGFDQAALDAVLKWKFRPGRKNGANVPTRVIQPLSFNLTND